MLLDPDRNDLQEGGAELIDRWRASDRSVLWLRLEGEEPSDEASVLSTFGVHQLAIVDAQRSRHPPKLEVFEDHGFILFKALTGSGGELRDFSTHQFSLFIGTRYLITMSRDPDPAVERVWSGLVEAGGDLPPAAGAIGLRLCRAIVDRYLPMLLGLENRLDEIEDEMLERPSDDLLAELVRYKADLKRLLRILQYHVQVFAQLRSIKLAGLEQLRHESNDVYEQLERHLSLARLHHDLVGDLMDGYLSLSSHRLNKTMMTLTVVTVVFVPLGFLAGIYGMNFEYIPELSFRYGYFGLLSFMALVASGILALFKWRGWI